MSLTIPMYQVDAFASKVFEGNPAAVCPLDEWLPDNVMQSIANENNLSETAFFVPEGASYRIRWFTPEDEVELCGHATLASAFVLFNELDYRDESVTFDSLSGPLIVSKDGGNFVLDFPALALKPADKSIVEPLLGTEVEAYFQSMDDIIVFKDEDSVRNYQPDFRNLEEMPNRGILITAPGKDYDFVARVFAPSLGIDEDPATGSAYSQLGPLWQERLGKSQFKVRQLSKRGADVFVTVAGDRVYIAGPAVKFSEGKIVI